MADLGTRAEAQALDFSTVVVDVDTFTEDDGTVKTILGRAIDNKLVGVSAALPPASPALVTQSQLAAQVDILESRNEVGYVSIVNEGSPVTDDYDNGLPEVVHVLGVNGKPTGQTAYDDGGVWAFTSSPSAPAVVDLVEEFHYTFDENDNDIYSLIGHSFADFEITDLAVQILGSSASTTATLAVQINGVSLGGNTIAMTQTKSTHSYSSLNSGVAGNSVTMQLTDVASTLNATVSGKIKYT